MNDKDKLQAAIRAVRVLSIEAVQAANSGHPGMPLGAAPFATELFANHLKHNPKNPSWDNRDRFVLSAGHGSMLLYSLLHLFGYGLTLDDLKAFRQWDSKTPGHPEYGHTVGVETTTGPLGQGIASAVGMAMAEAHLAAIHNEDGFPIVDHYTYALVGDGCLMEGISSEASSLAGHLKLHKLIVLYDSNDITIEGSTNLAFTEDVLKRYEAYGWHVQEVENGEDTEAVAKAIQAAKANGDKPSFIKINTVIGFGSPEAGSASTHGSPLGDAGVLFTKKTFGIEDQEAFTVPTETMDWFADQKKTLEGLENDWNDLFSRYKEKFPEKAKAYEAAMSGELPDLDDETLYGFVGKAATRKLSGQVLNHLATKLPTLFGGSADLAPSNNSEIKGGSSFQAGNYEGRNIHFGVREFAMAAMANGMAVHGGIRPYVATFFVFTDYMKAAMRLSALMKAPVIYILTHDSIGVGEDGPTHEPIEHLAMLRSLPGMTVFRPADGRETAVAYRYALENDGPTCLVLTRQDLPEIDSKVDGAKKGAYVLSDDDDPELLLLATGSEVSLILEAATLLRAEGKKVRVVSMPSFEVFEAQSDEYKESVLPAAIEKRMAVEAAATMPWYRYVGLKGKVHGIDRFGASAPGARIFKELGFTPENIASEARSLFE